MMNSIAFAIILLAVSQMPIGRTPGHLSRAISLQAIRAVRPFGSTNSVLSLLARSARELHRSCEADLKDVQSLLQLCASIPEGPVAPVVQRAAERMELAFENNWVNLGWAGFRLNG